MSDRKWVEVHVRAADHAQRLAIALVGEEVTFAVTPEPDGWWRFRARTTRPYLIGGDRIGFGADDLAALEQSTRRPA